LTKRRVHKGETSSDTYAPMTAVAAEVNTLLSSLQATKYEQCDLSFSLSAGETTENHLKLSPSSSNLAAAAANPSALTPSSSSSSWLTGTFEDIDSVERTKIADGSFCKIYKLQRNREMIAFKAYPASLSDRHQPGVMNEKSLWEKLEHPNIVKFIGLARTAKRVGFLMEYLPENLVARYTRAPLSDAERIRVLTDVCQGLDYLHKHSILHRDIRGTNILLTEMEQAKLTDFGLSRTLRDVASEHFSVVNHSTDWCAPETWQDINSVATDIYSIGMTLLEMTLRKNPFSEYSPLDPGRTRHIFQRITQDNIPCLPFGDLFKPIYEKCTKLDPNDRYQSAAAVSEALTKLHPS
ncbi:MAG: serine/threonine protein kinase, partial [Chlamydiia bacterium]|nr:serine/threonine protein kinase [Chlamydiia bacterium]